MRRARSIPEWADEIIRRAVKTERGCFEFRGRIDKKGYGHIFVGGRNGTNLRTHRIVYEAKIGPLPEGRFVCHSCDNPLCCNPSHLFLSDHEGNMRDMKEKKRAFVSWGEKSGLCKLTTEQVRTIRGDPRKIQIIANDFGVTKSTISAIKNRKSRKYE